MRSAICNRISERAWTLVLPQASAAAWAASRAFDVGGVGARKLGDGLTVDRGKVGEVLTAGRLDELAVDVIAVAGFEGNDSAFAAGMGVTHDESPVL